jgi:hypothetical protein
MSEEGLSNDTPGQTELEAVPQLRNAPYTVKRSRIPSRVKTLPDCIDMNVIYVKEEKPPAATYPLPQFLHAREEAGKQGRGRLQRD